jgi:hypothetical protein
MKNVYKVTVIVLILVGSTFSCANKNENISDPETEILGRWKLVTIESPMSGQSFDYSKYKIVFDFKA